MKILKLLGRFRPFGREAGKSAWRSAQKTIKQTGTNSFVRALAVLGALSCTGQLAPAQPVILPVYHVVQSGATASQASALASFLGIPTSQLMFSNGLVSFIDPTNYLFVPTVPVSDPVVASNLAAGTFNEYPSIPITAETFDFASLSNLSVLDSSIAMDLATSAFQSAGLTPQFGNATAHNANLSIWANNASNTAATFSQDIDAEVEYQFQDTNGYPIIGPGAQVQVAFDGDGNVTRLFYAARQMVPGQTVPLIPAVVASNRVAHFFPPNVPISTSLVYWAPPLWPPWPWPWPPCDCPDPTNPVVDILPYYVCHATLLVTNPVDGTISTNQNLTQMIPATDDTNFVPSLNLSATNTPGGTQVVASVSVFGGHAPYAYAWSGSSATASSNGPAVAYTPIVRVLPPALQITSVPFNSYQISWLEPDPVPWILESAPGISGPWAQVSGATQSNGLYQVTVSQTASAAFFRLRLAATTVPATETVGVTVTDANGVSVNASQTLTVQAIPVTPTRPDSLDDFGTESAYDPGVSTIDRLNWTGNMLGNGLGPQRFLWTSPTTWKGDFVDPPGPNPHLFFPAGWDPHNGDDDYLNWGIDAANIVLYIGHGGPSFLLFTATPPLFYNGVTLFNGQNVGINQSWGDDRDPRLPANLGDGKLDWLGLLSDRTMVTNWAGPVPSAVGRWGPAFDGLHSLLGFRSPIILGTGFPGQFANNLAAGQKVYLAWANAAKASGAGQAAIMGPVDLFGTTDLNDHYWGHGAVHARIPAANIASFWYLAP
jgi:hypothetical protein